MSDFLPAGTSLKVTEVGPLHKDGQICANLSVCGKCQGRLLQIYTTFFQDKITNELRNSPVKEAICAELDCPICLRGKVDLAACPATGCAKKTGEQRCGLLALEVLQYHHEKEHLPEAASGTNKASTTTTASSITAKDTTSTSAADSASSAPSSANSNANQVTHVTAATQLKTCGCLVHVRPHIICSQNCYKQSMFANVPLPSDAKFDDGVCIGDKGALAVLQQYLLEVRTTSHLPPDIQNEIHAATEANLQAMKEKREREQKSGDESEEKKSNVGGGGVASSSASSSQENKDTPAMKDLREFVLGGILKSNGEVQLNLCLSCGGADAKKWCGRCRDQTIRYCSKECQAKHWPTHKPACVPAPNAAEAVKQ